MKMCKKNSATKKEYKIKEKKPKISLDTTTSNGICRIFNSSGKRPNG
jgi:hypothetical protein